MWSRRRNLQCCVFLVLLFVSVMPGCVEKIERACEQDTDCQKSGPNKYCFQGFCSAQACAPGQQRVCYNGPVGTAGKGSCRAGQEICLSNGRWSSCVGQVLPQREICDRTDNNCDGQLDNVGEGESCICQTPGQRRQCYSGKDKDLIGVGECRAGVQYCETDYRWGKCRDEQFPVPEACDGKDNDCNGKADDHPSCECEQGQVRECYDGAAGTVGVGSCRRGIQRCQRFGAWGKCEGQATPSKEVCGNKIDEDCDGQLNNGCGTQCPQGQSSCGDQCFDLKSNNKHCGTCQKACVAQQICIEGQCKCPAQQDACGNACVDTQTDIRHCGACDQRCGLGQDCVGGRCRCQKGATCGTSCIDLQTSQQHCGKCGNTCRPDQGCIDGKCTCAPGTQLCGGRCIDLKADSQHCGACDRKCPSDKLCIDGRCGYCKAPKQTCGVQCVDLQNDDKHCGQCGLTCGAKERCKQGKCVCANGEERVCYTGPAGTKDQGLCTAGKQTCRNNTFQGTACVAQVLPQQEANCDGKDEDCDGTIDEGLTLTCYTGFLPSRNIKDIKAPCKAGIRYCRNGQWGACLGQRQPQQEVCDGLDNDCNGQIDEDNGSGGKCQACIPSYNALPLMKGGYQFFHINQVRFSGDTRYLAAASNDGQILVWNAQPGQTTGRPYARFQESGYTPPKKVGKHWLTSRRALSLSFHPNHQLLLSSHTRGTSGGQTLVFWDLQRRQNIASIPYTVAPISSAASRVVISPDGNYFATADFAGPAALWNVKTRQVVKSFYGWKATTTTCTGGFTPCPPGNRCFGKTSTSSGLCWSPAPSTGPFTGTRDVAFSPDSKWLAIASNDWRVMIWDIANNKWHKIITGLVPARKGSRCNINSNCNSGERCYFGTCWSYDPTKGHDNSVTRLIFSPDGSELIVAATDKAQSRVTFWDTKTWALNREIKDFFTDTPTDLALNYNATMLAIAEGPVAKRISLWEIGGRSANGKKETPRFYGVRYGHSFGNNTVAWSKNNTMATGGNESTVKLWLCPWTSRNTAAQVPFSSARPYPQRYTHALSVLRLAFSPDGLYLASSSADKTVVVWNTQLRQELHRYDRRLQHPAEVTGLAFSPSEASLFLATASAANALRTHVYTALGRNANYPSKQAHSDKITALTFAPLSQLLLSGSKDNTIRLWNPYVDALKKEPWIRTYTGHTDRVTDLSYSPDNKWFASSSHDESIRIWDAKSNKVLKVIAQAHKKDIFRVKVSPDGRWLVSAGQDGEIKLWDVQKNFAKHSDIKIHTDDVNDIAFSPDGRYFVSASTDHKVKVWDMRQNKVVQFGGKDSLLDTSKARIRENYTSVAWSPDGQVIAVGNTKGVVKFYALR